MPLRICTCVTAAMPSSALLSVFLLLAFQDAYSSQRIFTWCNLPPATLEGPRSRARLILKSHLHWVTLYVLFIWYNMSDGWLIINKKQQQHTKQKNSQLVCPLPCEETLSVDYGFGAYDFNLSTLLMSEHNNRRKTNRVWNIVPTHMSKLKLNELVRMCLYDNSVYKKDIANFLVYCLHLNHLCVLLPCLSTRGQRWSIGPYFPLKKKKKFALFFFFLQWKQDVFM